MRNKSVVWIPLLFLGSMVYWTLAFGLGQRSLQVFPAFHECDLEEDQVTTVKDSYQSITVNLTDLIEAAPIAEVPAGAEPTAVTVDLVSDRDSAVRPPEAGGAGLRGGAQPSNQQGPGETAF